MEKSSTYQPDYEFNLANISNKVGQEQLKQILLSPEFDRQGFKQYEFQDHDKWCMQQKLAVLLVNHAGDKNFDILCEFLRKYATSVYIGIKLGSINRCKGYCDYLKSSTGNIRIYVGFGKDYYTTHKHKKFEKIIKRELKNDLKHYQFMQKYTTTKNSQLTRAFKQIDGVDVNLYD